MMSWSFRVRSIWALVLLLGAGALPLSCATVPITPCERLRCPSAGRCLELGIAALDDGQPDVALCHLERSLLLDRRSERVMLPLAISKLLLARKAEAMSLLKQVADSATDQNDRQVAMDWLTALGDPLPVAFFWAPLEACGSEDERAAAYAARALGSALPRFGAFRTVGDDVLPLAPSSTPSVVSAWTEGAGGRIGFIVQVTCRELSQVRDPTFLGGTLQIQGISKFTATVQVVTDAYGVETGRHAERFVGTGTASNVIRSLALRTAIDRAIANSILRMSTALLYGRGDPN